MSTENEIVRTVKWFVVIWTIVCLLCADCDSTPVFRKDDCTLLTTFIALVNPSLAEYDMPWDIG